ncbi:hypothetical protein [Stutzerimonas nitrititolerans]|uniref:hypothetical protein n=1 Tax=Stutzerimonas nitrititolerans TaxID=2482751 RepID=UPI0028A69707|nr:hypothetical protein [Stutzerimonas nitrititolerans]
MNRADPKKQSLIYADGYFYTEIFQLPDLPGLPGGNQLIRIFHPSSCDERDIPDFEPAPVLPSEPDQVA